MGPRPNVLFFQVRMKPAGRAGWEREAEGAGQRSKSTAGRFLRGALEGSVVP